MGLHFNLITTLKTLSLLSWGLVGLGLQHIKFEGTQCSPWQRMNALAFIFFCVETEKSDWDFLKFLCSLYVTEVSFYLLMLSPDTTQMLWSPHILDLGAWTGLNRWRRHFNIHMTLCFPRSLSLRSSSVCREGITALPGFFTSTGLDERADNQVLWEYRALYSIKLGSFFKRL